VSACSCQGRTCGDDGCGRICGYCIAGTACNMETHLCDPVATPTPEPADASPSQDCPPGQVWSAYAGACVLDGNVGQPGAGGSSDSGCAGGGARGDLGRLALVVGALGVFALRRYRTLKS